MRTGGLGGLDNVMTFWDLEIHAMRTVVTPGCTYPGRHSALAW